MSETSFFRLEQKRDQLGNPEEFTSDAYLILERSKTAHLQGNGLPKPGTDVRPGMCLIAKFGATKSYDKSRLPSDLESLTSNEVDLINRYSHMFYDASFYVPPDMYGVVESAEFDETDGRKTAVVRVRVLRDGGNSGSTASANGEITRGEK